MLAFMTLPFSSTWDKLDYSFTRARGVWVYILD
jgi:hypothetical protein